MNTAKNLAHSDNSASKTTTFKTLEGYCFGFDGSKCEECGGKCCAGESGYVFLSIAEMQEIARFLGVEFEVFTQKYVRKVGYKFSLLEKIPKMQVQDSKNPKQLDRILDSKQPKNVKYAREAEPSGIHFREGDTINGIECIFFENGKCAIYPVRPKQCRDFPFWESHKILDADSKEALELECKGIIFFS
ncbi:YkgJ family cysteine cluster protein [Helicobacter himalayensis]|uniref:YkgJ family cysteine cluster protein n=1 Tax=Helicobacter himalayensis TaxID=1591088 RepID=UPI003D6E39C7